MALRDELGIDLPDGHYETLSGFLLNHFREIPKAGDTMTHDGAVFSVIKAARHSIREVEIQLLTGEQTTEEDHLTHAH